MDVQFDSGFDRRSLFRYTGAAGLALGGATLLGACSTGRGAGNAGSGASAMTSKIVMQLSWIKNIEFAGEYYALSKGYYKAAGLGDVDLIAGGQAATGVESGLTSNRVWIGTTAPQLTAPAVLKGAPLMTVAATYQQNPFAIISSSKKPIKTPQDMRGKKIGVQDSNTLVFDALLKANNMKESDIDKVTVGFDPTELSSGRVDGWLGYVTNEPIILKNAGFDNVNFKFAEFGLPLVAETLVVRKSTVENERKKLKAFLLAEIKGWKDAVADPAESARLAVEVYGKDQKLNYAEQVEEAKAQNTLVESADTKKNGLLTMTDDLIAANIEALEKAGITITADKLFDMSVINEVYKEHPELKK